MKRPMWQLCCIVLGLSVMLAGCGSDQSSSPPQGSYKEMKTMVVDILKSDEGKKAVEEALTGQSSSSGGGSGGSEESGGSGGGSGTVGMKMLMPMQSSEQIRIAVKDTITAPEYQKEFEKIMTDPQFAGEFAKAINGQSKQLHMQLIKDPTYQKSIGDIMKSPEVSKMFMDMTKTPEYRKQTMTVMQEVMQNPLFRMEVLTLLKKVVQEELQPKTESGGGQKGQDGGDGGNGDSGGGDSGGGGGSS
ncbi:spore germination lipoprotein GerD [Paenibacillus polysaccharolyticus]|uniref:spore germination lipoprotein GerD n=1 Tax=Paenibacillus polysaccharolyticus TaxID=582692 RepID=UPI00203FD529|nr:spore germination lipoprotein GerD [Paenibacillus polysaccharolyticus]MCM3136502.1 spore germination lipoprotein GerD [Paenibacillus polysaccharolyticus]